MKNNYFWSSFFYTGWGNKYLNDFDIFNIFPILQLLEIQTSQIFYNFCEYKGKTHNVTMPSAT